MASSVEQTNKEDQPDSTNKQLLEKMDDIKKEIINMPK